MFSKIMAPVDLAHESRLDAALDCAADLARHYDVPIVYVGVTANTPTAIAHNPDEYARKLEHFARSQAEKHGVRTSAHAAVAHDPATEIDDALLKAVGETGADLVVVASHVPGVMDYIWPSHGGSLAEHAKCSVMVVRL